MIGTTLAHYRITGELGSGGMGEVWRAEDTKLDREVALKLLPADVAEDADRLARFEREAKVLASLNHPNIATLFGLETVERSSSCHSERAERVEESTEVRSAAERNTPSRASGGPSTLSSDSFAQDDIRSITFLVMELVEGEDLSEKIARGAIPIDDAIPIALQIAEALEAAHEAGIVHRDLKPANIKLTEDGTVKVLDFGLAKAWESDHGDSSLSLSPTLTQHATAAGVILGTAAYMSPEQARGKKVDRRADVWSFGVVLWEMLTGHKLFDGETVSDVMAAVLTRDLDMSELPREVPSYVRQLIERCLRRDQRRRIRDIGDVRIVLEEGEISSRDESDRPGVAAVRSGWPVRLGLAGLLVMAGAIAIWSLLGAGSSGSTVDGPIALSVMLPPEMSIGGKNPRPFVAISPDGSEMVVAAVAGGSTFLYRRSLGASDFVRLDGTEDASSPFYSPDGRWIGFNSDGDSKLKKISLDGGQVTIVADADWGGGSWGEDDTIVYTRHYTDGLWRASASGGDAHELTRPDPTLRELNHSWPDHVPGTDAVIFTSFRTPIAASRTEMFDTVNGERRVLIENALFARYVSSGHLVFVRDGVLLAAPFDRRSMELTGSPVPVVADTFVAPFEGNSQFAISDNGVAVWIPASILQPPSEVVLVDREGRSEVLLEANRSYKMPAFSPDGRKLALTIDDGSPDVWVYEMSRRVLNRLTFSSQSEFSPLWYPDGHRIVFVMDDPIFNLYSVPEDGSTPPQELLKNPIDSYPNAFTPDGKRLVIHQSQTGTNADLEILSLGEGDETTVFRSTPFSEKFGAVSPDGRFLAYQSNESGRVEIYIQNLLDGGDRVQVTRSGGAFPRWGRSSELFFKRKNEVVAVPVRTAPTLELGEPVVLFEFAGQNSSFSHEYDVSADGQTFVFTRIPEASRSREIRVFLNWFTELERLAGGGP